MVTNDDSTIGVYLLLVINPIVITCCQLTSSHSLSPLTNTLFPNLIT